MKLVTLLVLLSPASVLADAVPMRRPAVLSFVSLASLVSLVAGIV